MNRGTWAASIAAAGWAAPVWSCTLCYSRVAQDVRAALFAADFWPNLAALLLPFPILAAAVLIVRRAAP
jgi:hypothetical protein